MKSTDTQTPKQKSLAVKKQNRSILKAALDVAGKMKASTLFVYVDAIDETLLPAKLGGGLKLALVTKRANYTFPGDQPVDHFITVPKLKLGRMGLVKISVLLALSAQYVDPEDTIVFVTGKSDFGLLDTILCFQLKQEQELLTGQSISQIPETIHPSVFQHALTLAIELAYSGKEGKHVGTIFVLGDEEKVLQLSKQMIINPFKGYDPDERNLLNPDLKETIREFSSIDGAFIISGDGEVLCAGRYLGAAMEGNEVLRGLGSRHIAAAGITALTNAVAIVISESTGDIRIFRDGNVIMEIEKPN